jgi:DUF1680 family protein
MKDFSLLFVTLTVLIGHGGTFAAERPEARFVPLKIGEVQPRGWLQVQLEQDVTIGYLSHLPELTPYVTIETFNAAAKGSMYKPPIGAVWWSGEQTGCWLDGYIRAAYQSDNKEAVQKADALVEQILSFQEPDGYLGVYDKDSRFEHPPGWQNGELWAQTTLFRGLLAYYELTGRRDVLVAVEKAAKLSMAQYDESRPHWRERIPRGGPPHSLMFVDICEWLYRLTEDSAYVDFAQFLYDTYNEPADVFEYDCLLRSLSDEEKLFNGHGVHALEHVRVPYFLYYATGDEKYSPVKNYPMKIARHLNAGGAVVCDEDILQRLAGPEIGCEYCTMQELEHSMQSVFQKSGQAFAGDWIERVAFNAAQGARMQDGRAIAYLSSDNQPEASVARGHGGRFKFSPTHEDVALCCVNWAGRFYPYYVDGMWVKTADGSGLAACTYGPSVLKTDVHGVAVTIEQNTIYPFEDQIEFIVFPEKPVSVPIYFRNPGWSEHTEVIADGAAVSREGGFIKVEKKWQAGDRVRLVFEAEVQQHKMSGGSQYWTRGPLTYSLPIASQARSIKAYGESGFDDYDILPVADDVPEYALVEESGPFTFQRGATDAGRPWEHCGLKLEGRLFNLSDNQDEAVELVPEGTSLLRQTAFKNAALYRYLPLPENLALQARVEVSSASSRHPASGVNNGRAAGYPAEPASEWASDFETTGAKVRLVWDDPVTIENIWLFDRPNTTDHVKTAWINFSNGSSILAEGFDNEGLTPVQLNFPEKTVTWIEVIVTQAGPKTVNAGFSEIAVFKDNPESK